MRPRFNLPHLFVDLPQLGEKIIELSAELEGLMGRTLTISQLKTQMSALEAELNADKTLLRKYKEEVREVQLPRLAAWK